MPFHFLSIKSGTDGLKNKLDTLLNLKFLSKLFSMYGMGARANRLAADLY